MPKRKTPAKSNVSSDDTDFSKLTVAQLRAECENRGLETSGKKQELVGRLQEQDDEPAPKMQKQSTMQRAMALVEEKSGQPKKKKKHVHKLDEYWFSGGTVFGDYSCMLNQTNIGHNNNKYYVIQIIQNGNKYSCWNRWGRVGEPGANATRDYTDTKKAIEDFKKKFKDKTKNDWDNKNKFKPAPGKYTLLEMDEDNEDQAVSPSTKVAGAAPKIDYKAKGCSLDQATQALLKLVFDHDMFKNTMTNMNMDMQKMPLGKLSKTQVLKGFKVLEELQSAIEGSANRPKIEELSSKFYTLIPQNFGRQRPPAIDSKDALKKNADLLVTLGDIAEALDMQKQQEVLAKEKGDRFKKHGKIKNRKLLWHGTKAAVAAAIMKSGLRIMPQSCAGLYFGSECTTSLCYADSAHSEDFKNVSFMFLNEVALGKEFHRGDDDWDVKKKAGYDSVVKRGQQEPDEKFDTTMVVEGNEVVVPQGEPVDQPDWVKKSEILQSEYVVHEESQVRIRYLMLIDSSN